MVDLNISSLNSKNNNIDLSLKLKEIMPIEFNKEKKVYHFYKRIKVEELTRKRIEDLYYNLNFKKLPAVTELPNLFLIVYPPKPPILISKENGKLYTIPGKWPIKEVQHQASLVIRVLSTFNFVENYKRASIRRKHF